MGRTYIVGDVHGCADELDNLIGLIPQPGRVDQVVMVGDLVDRGPESGRVLQLLRQLETHTTVVVVRGNHEQRHLNGRAVGPEDALLTNQELDQLRASRLYHRLPVHNALVVHGGIPIGLQQLPDQQEDARHLPSRDRKRVAQVMYTIKVEQDNVKLTWPWAYDGRFGHVYFGHRATMAGWPTRYPHATGLDLGCVYGGHLCCAVLETGRPVQFLKVRARRAYAQFQKEETCAATTTTAG